MRLSHKHGAPTRCADEIGPGDYVKVKGCWRRVTANSALTRRPLPREWWVVADGESYSMWDIELYAKAEDMECT